MSAGSITLKQLQQINRDRGYLLPDDGSPSLAEAWNIVRTGQGRLPLQTSIRRNNNVYQPKTVIGRILENAASQCLMSRLGIRQADRNQIVSNVRSLLEEGSPLRVYQLDIKSFYESIPRDQLLRKLRANWRVPRPAIGILECLFGTLSTAGLPRGLAVSATLSELYMRSFDERIKQLPRVYYYARFVDDIVVMTTGDEDDNHFKATVVGILNDTCGLKFNDQKERIVEFTKEGEHIDYLGYRFLLEKTSGANLNNPRKLSVDIAPSKIKRMKLRICLSIISHCNHPSFSLLRDRIQLLTSNYFAGQRSEHQKLRAGIYYSYCEVTARAGLTDLDVFLRRVLCGTRMSLSRKLRKRVSAEERATLLRFSFIDGHKNKRLLRHNSKRLKKLTECWRHV